MVCGVASDDDAVHVGVDGLCHCCGKAAIGFLKVSCTVVKVTHVRDFHGHSFFSFSASSRFVQKETGR
jgi:hypothetical protein